MDKSAYILRISQASPTQLVVINFELAVEFMETAIKNIGSPDAYHAAIQKSKDAIQELIEALNFEVTLAHDFFDIYKFIFKKIVDAEFSRDPAEAKAALMEALDHTNDLLTGWRALDSNIEHEAPSEHESLNAPKVYSGLTYGRKGQAEEYIAEDESRGYMA